MTVFGNFVRTGTFSDTQASIAGIWQVVKEDIREMMKEDMREVVKEEIQGKQVI